MRRLAPAGAAALTALVEGEDEADLIADRVAGAVGLSTTSAPTEETNWAVRKLFEALARHRPLVVVLDDLHWAEPTFLDLVEHVGRIDARRPTPGRLPGAAGAPGCASGMAVPVGQHGGGPP